MKNVWEREHQKRLDDLYMKEFDLNDQIEHLTKAAHETGQDSIWNDIQFLKEEQAEVIADISEEELNTFEDEYADHKYHEEKDRKYEES